MSQKSSPSLQGKRIVVTRSREQAPVFVEKLTAHGADVIQLPVIQIVDPKDKREFAELVTNAHTYDWLAFTSTNGVHRFFDAFFSVYQDARSIGGVKIACVGSSTEEAVNQYRYAADLVPENQVAEGLLEEFKNEHDIENQTILWVRPEKTRSVISEGLTKQGAIVDECIAYRTVPETEGLEDAKANFTKNGADAVIFASPSAVEFFHEMDLPWPKNCQAISIGPITSEKLDQLGYKNVVEAKAHSVEGILEELI